MTTSPPAVPRAIAVACSASLLMSAAGCSRPPAEGGGADSTEEGARASLPFTEVQHDRFAVPGSFANSWGDFDNDGDLDLAVSIGDGEVRLYRNDRGTLVSVGRDLGMPQSGSQQLRGVGWGDYDQDGFLDLIGGAFEEDHVTKVMRNEGGEGFSDVAAQLGLTIPERSSRPTTWVDVDNDGDLDVYATNRTGPNALYRNDGGRFTLVPGRADDPRPTVGACWFDMDTDGDLDLFLANQAGEADALWRNDGSTFTDVAAALGMAGPERTTAEGGVGCALGDYDNDGDLDVFVATYGHDLLYRNRGDGAFDEVARSVGIDVENHAVSADWGDVDNDGDLDLFVASYVGSTPDQEPANALFLNDGHGRFTDALPGDSPLNAADHSVQFVDYDGDGGLDLSVTDGYGPEGGHFLFRNTLPDEARARSLSVLVLDAEGHHTRFGAEVRLFDASGRVLATRPVVTWGGYNAQTAGPVHFGLKDGAPVRVEVTFLTPRGRRVVRIDGVDPAAYRGRSLVVRQER